MNIQTLPDVGVSALREEWGATGGRKASCPPVALTPDGPVAIYYLRDVATLPDETQVVWSWPGQWRNDVFLTTLGEIR